jgi:two-component system, OmpR family, sensor histidine kinase KdpD
MSSANAPNAPSSSPSLSANPISNPTPSPPSSPLPATAQAPGDKLAASPVWQWGLLGLLALATGLLLWWPDGRWDWAHKALLLIGVAGAVVVVMWLVPQQRRLAAKARGLAQQATQLHDWGERLREAEDPWWMAPDLQHLLSDLTGAAATVYWLGADGTSTGAGAGTGTGTGRSTDPNTERWQGPAAADEQVGLRLCAQGHGAMGPDTGRHEDLPAWYLPLRGRRSSFGAALVRWPVADGLTVQITRGLRESREHAQALCDAMGLALERAQVLRNAAVAQQAEKNQVLRSTLLAAIAHDHRTPLATILGAASSLHDQADRLDVQQRRRLAATIVDEAGQLVRLTENTLQLARLDAPGLAPGLALRLDWESAEELIGTVMRRMRGRDLKQRVRARVEPALPLLRCDAVLLVQLLDNLVDNALKYGDETAQVELLARRLGDHLVLAVRDRGMGVPLAHRQRIFEVFQRGGPASVPGSASASTHHDIPSRRGAGVGLAVCRAIANAHGGELRLRPRGHGGTAFECWLPLTAPPTGPHDPYASTTSTAP